LKFINFKNEKLFLDECEIESPKENQIQIEVHSTGVNRADILQKKGHYPPPKGESEIIGLECAGIVCKIGPNSSKFKVGDKVCAILGGGGYAEFVNVDERQVMPIPSNVSLLEAGALPETILTVYENIFNISEFKNNEVVLIHGGSSGIGTTAISILKNFTDQLYVTAGSKDKCDNCIQLGAKAAINYKEEDFEQYFIDQKIKVDIILDMVGGSYFKKNLKILNQKGRLTYIAALESIKAEANLLYIMTKQLKVSGSTLRSRSPEDKGKIVNQVIEHIWPLIEQGKYKPTIFQSFNMEDVNLAHELMESSSHIGKILLDIKGG
jgi:putative PIG3 family NAD(P)H quinone oxidoreductase|tara:strand:+ start:309 stop:1277 length:969 start_codon:yes stop_codon:yes gene_type:complete